MIRLLFLALISIGLVACGSEENTASEVATEDAGADVAMETQDQSDSMEASDMMVEDSEQEAVDTLEAMQASYLMDYAQQDGTIATGTGLLYQVVREGEGPNPGPTDIVEVHYEGRLVDGTVFDSSYQRDETIEFPLNRVIPGWTEGLQYMQPGAEHILVIPPELGYGSRGAGDVIPPNAVLVFRVELFNVTPSQ